MKIAILGAGFAALAAAHELARAHHEVTVYEQAPLSGGAAGGFKLPHWASPRGEAGWYLDYAYHHWFTNDTDILNFCRAIGWHNILVKRPITASAYTTAFTQNALKTSNFYQLDSPLDLLAFPLLSPFERLRVGMVLAALKYGPPLNSYHTHTTYELFTRWMGKRAWEVLWEPLMAHKFESYAHDINAMFFWARVHKRTPRLAYPGGGYQALANYTVSHLKKQGVVFHFNTVISSLTYSKSRYYVNGDDAGDAVISTLPSPIFLKLEKNILPQTYRARLSHITYLGAQAVIYETKKPLIKDVYWLSIADMKNPWMVLVQHTNFIDPVHFGGKHLAYLARYTNKPLTTIPLKKYAIQNKFIPNVQPLYTTNYVHHMPHTVSPVKGLYFANMELTYPYDRGTNYAVKVGKDAATALLKGVSY